MSLNPTALKFMAPTVKVCTKASMQGMMPDFALGVATTTIIGMTMTMRVNVDPPTAVIATIARDPDDQKYSCPQ